MPDLAAALLGIFSAAANEKSGRLGLPSATLFLLDLTSA